MGECSERIQSKLLHFKGRERPLVKEFPMENGIGVKLYKGLWVNIPPSPQCDCFALFCRKTEARQTRRKTEGFSSTSDRVISFRSTCSNISYLLNYTFVWRFPWLNIDRSIVRLKVTDKLNWMDSCIVILELFRFTQWWIYSWLSNVELVIFLQMFI